MASHNKQDQLKSLAKAHTPVNAAQSPLSIIYHRCYSWQLRNSRPQFWKLYMNRLTYKDLNFTGDEIDINNLIDVTDQENFNPFHDDQNNLSNH